MGLNGIFELLPNIFAGVLRDAWTNPATWIQTLSSWLGLTFLFINIFFFFWKMLRIPAVNRFQTVSWLTKQQWRGKKKQSDIIGVIIIRNTKSQRTQLDGTTWQPFSQSSLKLHRPFDSIQLTSIYHRFDARNEVNHRQRLPVTVGDGLLVRYQRVTFTNSISSIRAASKPNQSNQSKVSHLLDLIRFGWLEPERCKLILWKRTVRLSTWFNLNRFNSKWNSVQFQFIIDYLKKKKTQI